MTDPLAFLRAELAELEARALLRLPAETSPAEGAINLSSNDYLGLGRLPLPRSAVGVRGGSGASPLVVGCWPEHRAAEDALTSWLGSESTLLFASGYAANVGTISCLVGPGDVIYSDRLNHASIIDGCRLSGASVRVVPHLDADALEAALAEERRGFRRCLVVTESYFSMDGDTPDLPRLRRLTHAHDGVLYVDEAHALGVFGEEGRGLCAALGIRPDVLVGTLGKALGLHGAFVSGSKELRAWLWNRSRSLVFSTAISPPIAAAVVERLDAVRGAVAERARLAAAASRLRAVIQERGGSGAGAGPIIPWVLGEAEAALAVSRELAVLGVIVKAIRPPTVPAGTSRLRLAAHAALDEADLDRAVAALRSVTVGL